jgi:hypothetical protein
LKETSVKPDASAKLYAAMIATGPTKKRRYQATAGSASQPG